MNSFVVSQRRSLIRSIPPLWFIALLGDIPNTFIGLNDQVTVLCVSFGCYATQKWRRRWIKSVGGVQWRQMYIAKVYPFLCAVVLLVKIIMVHRSKRHFQHIYKWGTCSTSLSLLYSFSSSFLSQLQLFTMTIEWVYASGSNWVRFDTASQQIIETLWARDAATWFNSQSFRGPVYVDTSEMVVMYGSYAYTIARRIY